MKIKSKDKTIKTTSKEEDKELIELFGDEYTVDEVEKIVTTVYQNRDINIYYILDVLYIFGFDLLREDDIKVVEQWLKKHLKGHL